MSDEMTVVARFDRPAEAALARNYLEAHDLPAVLADDETVGMAWHLANAVGGVKLIVARRDAERALQLLQDRGASRRPSAQRRPRDAFGTSEDLTSDENDWDDEAEEDYDGADNDEDEEDEPLSPADELADRAFLAAVAGLIFCPLQLYSLYLLASLATLDEPPSPKHKRRAIYAGLLDLALFAYIFILQAYAAA